MTTSSIDCTCIEFYLPSINTSGSWLCLSVKVAPKLMSPIVVIKLYLTIHPKTI